MDFNKLEKKIFEVLNNLDSVVISNKLRAQMIRQEVESLFEAKPKVSQFLSERTKHVTRSSRQP